MILIAGQKSIYRWAGYGWKMNAKHIPANKDNQVVIIERHSIAGRRREHIRSRWPGGPVADGLEVWEQMVGGKDQLRHGSRGSRSLELATTWTGVAGGPRDVPMGGHFPDLVAINRSGRRPRGCSDGGTFAEPSDSGHNPEWPEAPRMFRWGDICRTGCRVPKSASIVKARDNSKDAEKLNEHLINIALATLSSKILFQHKAKLAVEAVLQRKLTAVCCWIRIPECMSQVLTIVHVDSDFIERLELLAAETLGTEFRAMQAFVQLRKPITGDLVGGLLFRQLVEDALTQSAVNHCLLGCRRNR
ncbi:chaperonin [Culex quinquefasciatus]|uniref:Chaperonin n=1 Tax=Culex quinquefasciatus TaxID=7176 RepID=B0W2C7_CULQU|nr:chaperonin [Culex quinquefasciatus]|eukprot:XP_001842830.1 chaperonin [Culex quinquefasciatus]